VADLNPDWTLDGRDVDVSLGSAVTSTEYSLAIDSTLAVTITVHDQRRQLQKSGILDSNKDGKLDQGIQIALDGALYRLASVKKTGDSFSLGFEDRIAARLRDAKGQMKPRQGEGHVRFAQRLVRLVGGEFVTPTGVAVASDSPTALAYKQARASADDRREKGLADEDAVTVKGVRVNNEQIRNIDVVLGVCAEERAGPKATLALVEACIVESTFRNLSGGDRDSVGILQIRTGINSLQVAKSVARSAAAFLLYGFTGRGGAISLAAKNPGWSAGEIAQAVQGSAFPGRYDQVRAEAKEIIDTYEGLAALIVDGAISQAGAEIIEDKFAGVNPSTGLPIGTPTTAAPTKTLIQRGTPDEPNESSWDALQRISKAKGYRCFALRNRIYYAREQDLIRSRPRMTLTEDSAGVDWIDWEWSPRKALNVATIQCRASLWAAPPGSAVILKESGGGNGRWLVSSFKRSRDFKSATIELRRGTELLQPPKTKESTGPVSQAGAGSIKAVCQTISDQHRKYSYGGGHGKPLDDITGSEALDCSSSCSLALKQAGVFTDSQAWVSGKFASSFGEAGRGKNWTCWANSEHVFLMSETEDDKWRFDTGGPGGGDGPRLRKAWRPTTGFTPRRVKGDKPDPVTVGHPNP
jgi:hypothetical protein